VNVTSDIFNTVALKKLYNNSVKAYKTSKTIHTAGIDYMHIEEFCDISAALQANAVFSPGRGVAGFPQEKLRWCIKSQEDAPI